MQVLGFDWLPDSRGIAFSHRPLPEWEHWAETRLATVAVSPGQGTEAERGAGPGADGAGHDTEMAVTDLGLVGDWTARPLVSPDGRWVACHTSDRPGKWALSGRVVLYPVEGAGGKAPAREREAGGDAGRALRAGVLGPSGEAVYVLQQSGVTPQLWALPASGAPARPVTAGTLALSSPARQRQRTLACVGQDLHKPNAVYHVEPGSGATRLVAASPLPEEWPSGAPPEAEVVRWASRDGLEIEGVLVYPPGVSPGDTLPPGGGRARRGPHRPSPAATSSPLDRTVDGAALAARGYAVLRPNPRGSTGYGRDFRFANYGDWGGGDLDDILDGVDWLIREGIVDGERLGIAGWSYGGYLAARGDHPHHSLQGGLRGGRDHQRGVIQRHLGHPRLYPGLPRRRGVGGPAALPAPLARAQRRGRPHPYPDPARRGG